MTTLLDEWNSARKHASHQISRINKESESIHSEMWDLCTQTSDVLDLIVKETTATQQDIEKLQVHQLILEHSRGLGLLTAISDVFDGNGGERQESAERVGIATGAQRLATSGLDIQGETSARLVLRQSFENVCIL